MYWKWNTLLFSQDNIGICGKNKNGRIVVTFLLLHLLLIKLDPNTISTTSGR